MSNLTHDQQMKLIDEFAEELLVTFRHIMAKIKSIHTDDHTKQAIAGATIAQFAASTLSKFEIKNLDFKVWKDRYLKNLSYLIDKRIRLANYYETFGEEKEDSTNDGR